METLGKALACLGIALASVGSLAWFTFFPAIGVLWTIGWLK